MPTYIPGLDILFITTDPAPIVQLLHILTLFITFEPNPRKTLLPILTCPPTTALGPIWELDPIFV